MQVAIYVYKVISLRNIYRIAVWKEGEIMGNFDSIRTELEGKTSFDRDHEEDLFKAIEIMEDAEEKGELVVGLSKIDYILTVIFIIVVGLGPLAYYAFKFF